MQRHALLVTSIILLATGGLAAQHQTVEERPGWIKPGSMLYGVDKAFDGAAMAVGLRSPASVAYERASEASVAFKNNNSRAGERALQDVGRLANRSNGNATGLTKAAAVLKQAQERTPSQADRGLQTALANVQQRRAGAGIQQPPMPGEPSGGQDNGSGDAVSPPPTP